MSKEGRQGQISNRGGKTASAGGSRRKKDSPRRDETTTENVENREETGMRGARTRANSKRGNNSRRANAEKRAEISSPTGLGETIDQENAANRGKVRGRGRGRSRGGNRVAISCKTAAIPKQRTESVAVDDNRNSLLVCFILVVIF